MAQKTECEYILRLFLNGMTPASNMALDNIRIILDEELKGKYVLDIVDVSKDPKSLRQENVIAIPTLIKKLPLPVRYIIGNMANKEKVLLGLDLIKKKTV